MAGYLGSLNSFHSFRENKAALRAHPLVMLMLLLRPPKKCLPCGKTVISEVHNWDPDTARDTEKKSETERRGGLFWEVDDGRKDREGEEKWSTEAWSWKSGGTHKRKAASQGTEREEKEEEEESGGKADGREEVRGSTGVQRYNYPD